ncbi:MAG: nucleotidyltransferase domain-containing protein [Nanoarchaeota archaeon]|nr:nucleotidyltransferase domain-containing protein [DPANN group archaeon]MBL7116881.1 nucleotidyltransferase domain-containing protein [Nanoarchaeota archaeon]
MRTDIIFFVFGSENRKNILKTILEYPKRQWSCSTLEDLTDMSHATVFRTLKGLRDFGILKSIKINKKDIIYELVNESPLLKELRRMIDIEKTTAKKIARNFVERIKEENILSAVLYGSSVRGDIKPDSDIDILIILKKHNSLLEREIFDKAGELSSKLNRTLAITIMYVQEIKKEKKSQFIKSVKANMEVIYGKDPF